jgi:hypothetical protein
MSPDECLAMRIPDLGVAILRRLRSLGEEWRSSHNFIQWTVDGNDGWFSPNQPITTSVKHARRAAGGPYGRQLWHGTATIDERSFNVSIDHAIQLHFTGEALTAGQSSPCFGETQVGWGRRNVQGPLSGRKQSRSDEVPRGKAVRVRQLAAEPGGSYPAAAAAAERLGRKWDLAFAERAGGLDKEGIADLGSI